MFIFAVLAKEDDEAEKVPPMLGSNIAHSLAEVSQDQFHFI